MLGARGFYSPLKAFLKPGVVCFSDFTYINICVAYEY